MESPILKLKREMGPNLILLTQAKTILKEDYKVHPEWKLIKEWYEATESHPDVKWIDKAQQTVLNSIIHQNRAVFGVTYKKTRELLKDDKNWKTPIGLSNNNNGKKDTKYNLLYNKLVEAGIIEQVKEQGHNEPRIYRVISEQILGMLRIKTSLEDQEAEVLKFVNDNKDLDKGNTKGNTKGSPTGDTEIKECRNIEMEQDIRTKSKIKISFEQLLFKDYGGTEYPDYPDLASLASYAVENWEDFDGGNYDMTIFKDHLLNMYSNPSKAQIELIDGLTKAFKRESKKYYSLLQIEGVELREPTELTSKAMKQSIPDEDKMQNHTRDVLMASFGQEKISQLKNKLKTIDDEQKKLMIQREIDFMEKIV
jgi:hypothetical protein